MTRPRPEAAQKVGLVILSAGVALLLAELALRLTGVVPAQALVGARLSDARFTVLLDCYPSNPRGYFAIDLRTPENRSRYSHVAPNRYDSVSARAPYAVESRYNSLRFRERSFADLPSGKTRVALLGDSFTEGQGVKEAETVARVLDRLLDARVPGQFDVVSCGRRGDDFPKLLETLDDCLTAEPDVVIYLMVLNDAEQSAEFRKRQTFVNDWILLRGHEEDATPPRLLQSRLVDLVKGRLDTLRVGRETTRWYREMYDEPNRAGWEHTQGYLREMDRRLRARGRRFGVGLWPLLVGLERDYPFASAHEVIKASCGAARIPFVDLRMAFAGSRTADLWVHPLDHHPNEHAHAAAARALVEPVLSLAPHI